MSETVIAIRSVAAALLAIILFERFGIAGFAAAIVIILAASAGWSAYQDKGLQKVAKQKVERPE